MLQLALPEQAAFMFANLEAGKGLAAALNIGTFLRRWETLETAPERKASRKADHEALVVMEEEGVTKERRTETRCGSTRFAIYAWLNAWSDMARAVITRRDQLIRLGIAKRRSPRKAKDVVVTPPSPPTPAQAASVSTQDSGEERSPASRAA